MQVQNKIIPLTRKKVSRKVIYNNETVNDGIV